MTYIPFLGDDWKKIENLYIKNHPGCIVRSRKDNEGNQVPIREVAAWFVVWVRPLVQWDLKKELKCP